VHNRFGFGSIIAFTLALCFNLDFFCGYFGVHVSRLLGGCLASGVTKFLFCLFDLLVLFYDNLNFSY
jgi:hypothetical protein